MPNQTGRLVIVTIANSGLGYKSAKALLRAGATVVMVCRNQTKAGARLWDVSEELTGVTYPFRVPA